MPSRHQIKARIAIPAQVSPGLLVRVLQAFDPILESHGYVCAYEVREGPDRLSAKELAGVTNDPFFRDDCDDLMIRTSSSSSPVPAPVPVPAQASSHSSSRLRSDVVGDEDGDEEGEVDASERGRGREGEERRKERGRERETRITRRRSRSRNVSASPSPSPTFDSEDGETRTLTGSVNGDGDGDGDGDANSSSVHTAIPRDDDPPHPNSHPHPDENTDHDPDSESDWLSSRWQFYDIWEDVYYVPFLVPYFSRLKRYLAVGQRIAGGVRFRAGGAAGMFARGSFVVVSRATGLPLDDDPSLPNSSASEVDSLDNDNDNDSDRERGMNTDNNNTLTTATTAAAAADGSDREEEVENEAAAAIYDSDAETEAETGPGWAVRADAEVIPELNWHDESAYDLVCEYELEVPLYLFFSRFTMGANRKYCATLCKNIISAVFAAMHTADDDDDSSAGSDTGTGTV